MNCWPSGRKVRAIQIEMGSGDSLSSKGVRVGFVDSAREKTRARAVI